MKYILIISSIIMFTACCSTKKTTKENTTITIDSLDRRCYMQPDPGMCRAVMPRYYYDSIDRRCKQFTWGGCQGVVPFITLEECIKACGCDTIEQK